MRLPIEDVLDDLFAALRQAGRAVLEVPPGAGKTTRVPLAMLDAGLTKDRIVLLEPRRLAARAAAERMAETLGETVGQTVGYRMRGESKVSKATRIEVVTEGILVRMLHSDPELTGVGAVIFDEFHERSLNADLGLALTWEAREALRDDLLVLVMSATLDTAPIAELLEDAPIVRSEGKAFPVETRWLALPLPSNARLETEVAALITTALAETTGGVLVFLPGQGEIDRVATNIESSLPAKARLHRLFGAAKPAAQRAAIQPEPDGARKLVLATAIAETSLTIPDVRVVIDAGKARRARFDPGSGMTRLVTERVSRAEAAQRKGRAGRVAPGVCYRCWARAEEGSLPPFAPPEIETADLAGLALDLAAWGSEPADLAFLTQPPSGPLSEARSLLQRLGALDDTHRITPHGRALTSHPVHPRLAHLISLAGAGAAPLAALLADRDPLRGAPVDTSLRIEALADPKAFRMQRAYAVDQAALHRIRDEARRLATGLETKADMSPGAMAALAYPDRVGLRRKGDAPRWVLSGGRGAMLDPSDPMANTRLIVVLDTDGAAREAKIRSALEISEADLREVHGAQISWHEVCRWSKRDRKVEARQQERFGAIVLADRIWRDAPQERITTALMEGVQDLGLQALKPNDAFRLLQARIAYVAKTQRDLPDVSDAALTVTACDWLAPFAGTSKSLEALSNIDLCSALKAHLGWEAMQLVDRFAPPRFETPLGRDIAIDYSGDVPAITVRVQEMFGVSEHPVTGSDGLPLKVTLLSPAGRPVQVTTDLPGFWASGYADLRKDMRGQYPKHPWPENPIIADPTLRTKRSQNRR